MPLNQRRAVGGSVFEQPLLDVVHVLYENVSLGGDTNDLLGERSLLFQGGEPARLEIHRLAHQADALFVERAELNTVGVLNRVISG